MRMIKSMVPNWKKSDDRLFFTHTHPSRHPPHHWHVKDLIWPSLEGPSAPTTKWKPLVHTLQTAGGAEPSQEKDQSSRFTGLDSVISACVLVFALVCKSESMCMCVNHYCWWCFLFLLRVIVGMPGGRHLEP